MSNWDDLQKELLKDPEVKREYNKLVPRLKLIKSGTIKGYTISNIKEVLSKKEYDSFKKWIYGQTVGIYKDEDLIYAHDFDRFLNSDITPKFKRQVKEFINEHKNVLKELAER